MSNFTYKPCDMLVDQNRYIGDTPVGYGCSNPGAWMTDDGHMVCNECHKMLIEEPHRITIPLWPATTPEQWVEASENILKQDGTFNWKKRGY